MPSIAPWLVPPNFLAAAEAGARIGLEQAGQAQQAREAAGRLNLGYSQLGSENMRSAASQKEADARLALERNRYADLTRLAEGRLDQGQQRLEETAAQHDAANALAGNRLALSQTRAENLNKYHQQALQLAYDRLQHMPDGPAKQAKAEAEASDVLGWLTDEDTNYDPVGTLTKYPNAVSSKIVIDRLGVVNDLLKQNQKPTPPAKIEQKRGSTTVTYDAPLSDAAAALGTNYLLKDTPVATPGSSPYKEGQIIRNKNDGKLYKVHNGRPLPME